MTKSKQWTIGAAFLAVLVLVAGYLLLIAPQRSDAADLKAQAALQEEQARQLQAKLEQLKVQEQELPQQQARLAEIRTKLPETPALPSLIRSLTVSAEAAGAEVITVAPSAPVDLEVAGSTAGAPAGAVQPSAEGATETAPAPAAAASTLKQIPLNIQVVGSYASLTSFVTQLEGLDRAMFVTGVAVSSEDNEQADEGELVLTLTSEVFMTAEQAAAQSITPTAAPSAETN